MKKKRPYQNHLLLLIVLFGVVISSCSDEAGMQIPSEQHAIAFASVSEEQESMTRTATALAHDFVVYGYKTMAGNPQLVFNGYAVKYTPGSANTSLDNTHGYHYVVGSQTIKYWDFGASEYNFWAYTGNKTDFNADGTALTISGLKLAVAEPVDINKKLFSRHYHRSPVSSDVVQLQFLRPYAKVRVMFYTSEELTGDDQLALTDISFSGGTGSIITAGSMTVTYSKTGNTTETITVTGNSSPESTLDALTFADTTLDATHGTASNNAVVAIPTGGTEWYYTLPLSTGASAQSFTMQVSIDDDSKTATVPAAYMHWQPNTSYTYIFKITEAGKKIEFYDVLVDPWKYGGSQEEEWRNW